MIDASSSNRKRYPTPLSALLLVGFALGCSGRKRSSPLVDPSHDLVLEHVTVVDTHDGHLTADMTVSMTAGKISAINRSSEPAQRAGTTVVDARGKFLVPGFIDGHAHIIDSPDAENEEALMLINGITGFRQMTGSPELLRKRQEGTLFQSSFAPKMLAMPGRILLITNAYTPAGAVREIDRQKEQGADFIKAILIPPPTFFVAVAEAKRVGLPIEGHLPPGVDPVEAVDAGYRSIEHLGPGIGMLVDCSTDEAAIKQSVSARKLPNPPPLPQFVVDWAVNRILRQTLLGEISLDSQTLPRMRHVAETFDEGKCRNLASAIAKSGSWQVPTLIKLQSGQFGDDPRFLNAPDLQYVAPSVRKENVLAAKDFSKKITPEEKVILGHFWDVQLKLTRMLDEAGVPMLAGSDSSGGAAGFNLHKEFALLTQAGFSPLKVLQMTTLNAAKFYGREATMGSVEVGRDADLVLLEANPIEGAHNLDRIQAVIRNGRLYSREELDAKLREIAQKQSK